jgi:protein tyrosine/serine phosphatase
VTELAWDGCVNVRDVGGIVRADNIRLLSDEGWQALVDHGVRRVIDLRFPQELADDVPRDAPVEVVHISLLGKGYSAEWQDEFDAAMDRSQTAADYLEWSYLEFLERFRDRFVLAFEAIANAPGGPVVVHCMGGKDRTGLVVALALRLAGESVDAAAADYARSEANLAGRHAAWVGAAPNPAERRRREMLLPTPASTMQSVLEELDRRYGSVEEYLLGGGLSAADVERVRARLQE